MKKFNFAEEFAQEADVVRLGDADDVRISYAVYVGSADENCIGVGRPFDDVFFSAADFTTWSDAAKARQLAIVALQQVDKNLEQGLKLSDVRGEVLAAISRAFSRADEKGCAVSKQEVLRAADSVLAANEKKNNRRAKRKLSVQFGDSVLSKIFSPKTRMRLVLSLQRLYNLLVHNFIQSR